MLSATIIFKEWQDTAESFTNLYSLIRVLHKTRQGSYMYAYSWKFAWRSVHTNKFQQLNISCLPLAMTLTFCVCVPVVYVASYLYKPKQSAWNMVECILRRT